MTGTKPEKEISVFWFRRDLRLDDNHALWRALSGPYPVLPIFIFDPVILSKLTNKSDARVEFIHDTLKSLKQKLESMGGGLQIYFGEPEDVYRKLFSSNEYSVKAIYLNEDYEPYALARDSAIAKLADSQQVDFFSFKDQVIFAKNEITKDAGGPYTVFTPYKKKWLSKLAASDTQPFKSADLLTTKKEKLVSFTPRPHRGIELNELGFNRSGMKFPSTDVSISIVKGYAKERDFMSHAGTSKLGLHLRFGTVSPRRLVRLAAQHSDVWLSELIWREFFMQILWSFPYVINGPFHKKYAAIKWLNDKEQFARWCSGQTGVPIVDAGMRELNATGFMHNRARMITASYLVKHLLIDWRWGEKYFAEKLLDFDLSANNGNWQWVAGTGCDAAPYFRVFNPDIQATKFDPDQKYIARWVPEYQSSGYVQPMVEHAFARDRALQAYKAIGST